MFNKWCVYKHTFPNNKVYIGITTKNPLYRWNNGKGYQTQKFMNKAIEKYGWDNIKHEILYNFLSEEEANQKEIELIEFYKSNNPKYGYNATKGGNGISGYTYSNETKEKIRKANLGKKLKPETRKKLSQLRKGHKPTNNSIIGQFNCDKQLIALWECSNLVKKEMDINVYPSLKKKYKPFERKSGGFYWINVLNFDKNLIEYLLNNPEKIKIYKVERN